jgi:hypothetical protein
LAATETLTIVLDQGEVLHWMSHNPFLLSVSNKLSDS